MRSVSGVSSVGLDVTWFGVCPPVPLEEPSSEKAHVFVDPLLVIICTLMTSSKRSVETLIGSKVMLGLIVETRNTV